MTPHRSARFKDLLKKAGYQLDNGRMIELDGGQVNQAPPTTPKKGNKTEDQGNKGSTSKKRKLKEIKDEEDDDAAAAATENQDGVEDSK